MQFPRQPLTGLALAAAAGVVLAEFVAVPILPLCLAIATAGVVCLVRPMAGLAHLLTAAGFFAFHLVQLVDAPGRELKGRLADRLRTVTVTGMVASEPKLSPNDYSTFLFRLDSIDLGLGSERSCATIQARWKVTPRFGDELRLRGMIGPIPPARNPGTFDLRAYLARQDVYDAVFVRYASDGVILCTGGGDLITRYAGRTRGWMEATLSRDLEDAPEVRAMINGMALGIRHESPGDIEEPFQQTGTLHLFAVAGLHVGIVAQLLWVVASLLRIPRAAAASCIIPTLFFYSAITGLHVSSVRAATMAAFLLGGIFFERPVLALNSLAGAALLILAVDSNQLFTSGFQLSFAVVATILLLQNIIFQALLRLSRTDPLLPRSLVSRRRRIFEQVYRFLASGISVSAAAWIGSLPLIIWYFYLITPISLLANLAVVPIAFCVLAVALMSLLSAPLSQAICVVLNNANWSLAKMILALVQLFARVPTGHLYVERPHWPGGATAEIEVLDAGAGAAIHLRTGASDWLFDAGSARGYEQFLRDYLHSRGINRLDGAFISHGDALHIGGAGMLIDDFRTARFVDSNASGRSSVHRGLIERLHPREIVCRGQSLNLCERISARILWPPANSRTKAADDQTLVAQLLIDQKCRVLLVSDSGRATERALLAAHDQLKSDILIKGQHYSGESGSVEFLTAVRPQLIIASSVDFPARERIPDRWAKMVHERGIRLFRQDETGAVRLQFLRDGWCATGFVNQEAFCSSSR